MYGGIFQTKMFAYGGDDVVNGYGFAFAVHDFAYDALRQLQVDFLVVYRRMGHNGDDNAFQVAHTVTYILCYIINYFRREL